MDWKATARLRKPHVRVYSEERDRSTMMLIDQRSEKCIAQAAALVVVSHDHSSFRLCCVVLASDPASNAESLLGWVVSLERDQGEPSVVVKTREVFEV